MKKLLAMMLMLLSLFFVACEDDEKDPLTAEEAQEELTQLATEMSNLVTDMQSSEALGV